ncbi:MAG: hypothetical protein PHH08_01280 [Candidatus ainarchaeum sp.]|nr:hypothetical protein [Candidatus ainarchaeum sp.]
MAFLKLETANATYLINLEDAEKFVDSIPADRRVDAAVSDFFENFPGGKTEVEPEYMKQLFWGDVEYRKLDKWGADILFLDPTVPHNMWVSDREGIRRKKETLGYGNYARLPSLLASASAAGLIGRAIYLKRADRKAGEKPEKITRRSFLGKTGRAAKQAALATALASPAVAFLINNFLESHKIAGQKHGELGAYRKTGLDFLNWVEQKHYTTLQARDSVVAERLESTIAPRMKYALGRKPVIAVYCEARHGPDLEKMLLNPALRKTRIEKAREIPELRARIDAGIMHAFRFRNGQFHWEQGPVKKFGPMPLQGTARPVSPRRVTRWGFVRRAVKRARKA